MLTGEGYLCNDVTRVTTIWSVTICVDSIVLPSGSLAFILFAIIIGEIVGVACFAGCIFAPESVIASMLLLVGLGGVSI